MSHVFKYARVITSYTSAAAATKELMERLSSSATLKPVHFIAKVLKV